MKASEWPGEARARPERPDTPAPPCKGAGSLPGLSCPDLLPKGFGLTQRRLESINNPCIGLTGSDGDIAGSTCTAVWANIPPGVVNGEAV